MQGWNILATAYRDREHELIRQLKPYGRFRRTGYRDVIVGWVEDAELFLQEIRQEIEGDPSNLPALSKLIPIDRTFEFRVEDFFEKAKVAVRFCIERIGNGSFHMRIERRGHKGELDSHRMEQEIGRYIHQELEKVGRHPGTDYEDPDMIVVIEMIGNQAGVSLITREMRERYVFVNIR